MIEMKTIFRALNHRNYRLFFIGQSVSLTGTWMQQVALSWLLYRLTHSAILLGLVGFIGQFPTFILAPLAGVIADRHQRQRLLILTQGLALGQAVILFTLFATHTITVWQIIVLSLIAGMINAFDIPLRQAFTIEMIEDKEDLSNAIALNASMVNLAKLLGPSIAGMLIVLTGEGVCFFLNALSYLAVLASLMAMRISHGHHQTHRQPIIKQIKEGFAYAHSFVPIRMLLLLLSVVSLVAGGFQTLMPVFARDIFGGGAQTLGFLMGASGLGALGGALYLASRKTVVGLGRVIPAMAAFFGMSMVGFSFCPSLPTALVMALCAGFGMMVQMAASNTMLQVIVEEDKRGRIMSLYMMALMGTAPIGSLLAGVSAHHWGVHKFLWMGGLLCMLGGLLFRKNISILREKVRPIYIKKGIIPEVAHGIQSATVEENFPRG
jgi:MFS family permease